MTLTRITTTITRIKIRIITAKASTDKELVPLVVGVGVGPSDSLLLDVVVVEYILDMVEYNPLEVTGKDVELSPVLVLTVVSVLSEIVTSDVKFSLPADVVIVDVFVADELFDTSVVVCMVVTSPEIGVPLVTDETEWFGATVVVSLFVAPGKQPFKYKLNNRKTMTLKLFISFSCFNAESYT